MLKTTYYPPPPPPHPASSIEQFTTDQSIRLMEMFYNKPLANEGVKLFGATLQELIRRAGL